MAGTMTKNTTKSVISADELKELLECPVCLRMPRNPPVYQCDRGHMLCNECHAKLQNCPVCRVPLGKTRSLITEKVLAKLPASCRFCDHGCEVEMMKTALDVHERVCPFRLVPCVDLACQQKISLTKLIDHMHKQHEREDFVHTEGPSYKSHFIVHDEDYEREIMWICDHLTLDGHHFFRECCRNNDGLWYVWVYMLGTPKDCEDYVFTVKIISPDKSEELSYKGKCLPLDIPKEKLSTVGRCLIFTDITAKQFWGNLRIHYSVEVHPNPKIKGNGGQRNSSGSVANSKPSPKPKKNHHQGQANMPAQSPVTDSQQNREVISPASAIPSEEDSADLQVLPVVTSNISQPQGCQSPTENNNCGYSSATSNNTSESNGTSNQITSPVNSYNQSLTCNKSRGSQTERSPATPTTTTGAAEARESAC